MVSLAMCGGREGGPNRCPTPLAIRKPNLSGRMYLMTPDEHRLLELLAESAEGCIDDLLTARGLKLDVLISVVSAEFATALPSARWPRASRWSARGCGSRTRGGRRWRIVPTKLSCRRRRSGRWPTGSSSGEPKVYNNNPIEAPALQQ
jgi:hypothetical protein